VSTDTSESGDDEAETPTEEVQKEAPAVGETVRDRLSAEETFQRIVADAGEEVERDNSELFFSGLAAGFAISLTFLLHAVVAAAVTGPGKTVLGALLYPLGFLYIIIGRYQLYTENTLPPVALVLERIASVPTLLRVWGIVLAANVVGAAAGTFVLANSGVMSPEVAGTAAEFGRKALAITPLDLFLKGLFAGWLVAGVVWMLHAVRDSVSRILLVYVVFLTIPAAELYHIVVSVSDVLYLVFLGEAALVPAVVGFLLPVLLGNTIGGVVLVTLVNYAQTSDRLAGDEESQPRLSIREWLFGPLSR
jgi:formate/nitrite transporter FocA (FNT family)